MRIGRGLSNANTVSHYFEDRPVSSVLPSPSSSIPISASLPNLPPFVRYFDRKHPVFPSSRTDTHRPT